MHSGLQCWTIHPYLFPEGLSTQEAVFFTHPSQGKDTPQFKSIQQSARGSCFAHVWHDMTQRVCLRFALIFFCLTHAASALLKHKCPTLNTEPEHILCRHWQRTKAAALLTLHCYNTTCVDRLFEDLHLYTELPLSFLHKALQVSFLLEKHFWHYI